MSDGDRTRRETQESLVEHPFDSASTATSRTGNRSDLRNLMPEGTCIARLLNSSSPSEAAARDEALTSRQKARLRACP